MPGPQRRGQLIERPTGFYARVRVRIDGELVRKCVPLETSDRMVARRKLARLLAGAEHGAPNAAAVVSSAAAPLTFAEAALEALGRWRVRKWTTNRQPGLRTAEERYRQLEIHAFPLIGGIDVATFSVRHAIDVLEAAAPKLGRQSLVHLKNAMAAVLDPLVDRQVITTNPAKLARLRAVDGVREETKRPRAILTDAELSTYLEWAHPEEKHAKAVRQRQTMAVVSRMFGGVRTGDLHAMRWEHFNLDGFTWGDALRLKTARPQRLEVPETLRPFLRAWHSEHGCPSKGFVFPVLRGELAGEAGKSIVSHAKALRRDLFRAGVRRHECTRPSDAEPARCPEPCCEGFASDPLFFDTPTTRAVDFHSFRRAFATAIANAGVTSKPPCVSPATRTRRRTWATSVASTRSRCLRGLCLTSRTGHTLRAARHGSQQIRHTRGEKKGANCRGKTPIASPKSRLRSRRPVDCDPSVCPFRANARANPSVVSRREWSLRAGAPRAAVDCDPSVCPFRANARANPLVVSRREWSLRAGAPRAAVDCDPSVCPLGQTLGRILRSSLGRVAAFGPFGDRGPDGTGRHRRRRANGLETHAARRPFRIRWTGSRGSSRCRSSTSLDTTTARSRLAIKTTEASMTSEVDVRPQRVPHASASARFERSDDGRRAANRALSGAWRAPSRKT